MRLENITISYPSKHHKAAKFIAENLLDDSETFQRKMGQYPELPITIIMAKNDEHYHQLIGQSSSIIEFSQACYKFSNQTIYIKNPRDIRNSSKLRKIILHEYIHHFVFHYIENPPLWFNEGMAVYFSNDLTYQRELNFVKNYLLGNSRKLKNMQSKYPENQIEWESFYSKSALAVKYIHKNEKLKFYQFWENVSHSGDFQQAFINSFYFTPDDFSNFFEQYSKKHFRVELLLASTGIIWAVLPFIFLIGVLRRWLINRKIKQDWEAD